MLSDQFHTESDLPQRKCTQFPKVMKRSLPRYPAWNRYLWYSTRPWQSLPRYNNITLDTIYCQRHD